MNLLRAKFNHFCTFKPGYPGMNFGRFVCEAYGEGKTSRPADVTDLGYQIVSGGGRLEDLCFLAVRVRGVSRPSLINRHPA